MVRRWQTVMTMELSALAVLPEPALHSATDPRGRVSGGWVLNDGARRGPGGRRGGGVPQPGGHEELRPLTRDCRN